MEIVSNRQQSIEFIRGYMMRIRVHNERLKSLIGRDRSTLEMDALVGKMFRVLTDLEEHEMPVPIPQKECDALHENVVNLQNFTKGK